MTDEPLDRLNKNGYAATVVVFYANLYPKLREVARQHGYALALHGSLTNDLDVVAIPWTVDAVPMDVLVTAITERAGGAILETKPGVHAGRKPHGRVAWTIMLSGSGGYIDLSVMPIVPIADASRVACDVCGPTFIGTCPHLPAAR